MTPLRLSAQTAAAALAALALASIARPAGAQEPGSLSDIMQRIQNELVAQGPVAFEGFAHDSDPPAGKVSDWTYTKRMEYSAFSPDTDNCNFNFHFKLIVNGNVDTDKDAGVPLRIVTGVKVATETDLLKIRDAQGGHPTYSSRLDPVIYDVDIVRNTGGVNEFSFYSLDTAQRVARLFEEAARRCGATDVSHF
jgi:hypothetical protein